MLKLWRRWQAYRARQERISRAFRDLSIATQSFQDAIVELHRLYYDELSKGG